MLLIESRTCECRLETDWKSWLVTGKVFIVYISMINGGCASDGKKEMHTKLRSSIIIKEGT